MPRLTCSRSQGREDEGAGHFRLRLFACAVLTYFGILGPAAVTNMKGAALIVPFLGVDSYLPSSLQSLEKQSENQDSCHPLLPSTLEAPPAFEAFARFTGRTKKVATQDGCTLQY